METKTLTKKELGRQFTAAINFIDDNFAYFLTEVIALGRPKWTKTIPTAAVGVEINEKKVGRASGTTDDISFMWNPDFASTLDVPDMAFILAHETLHVLLNHLDLCHRFVDIERRKELIEKYKGGNKLTKDEIRDFYKEYQNASMFNIAADCVINDYLVEAGFEISDFQKYCSGHDYIGESAAHLTVSEVFNRLKQEQQDQDEDGDENEIGNMISDMAGGRGEGALDSHDWLFDPDFADKMADMTEELQNAATNMPVDLQDKMTEENGEMTEDQKKNAKALQAGSTEGNMREFSEVAGVSMKWADLLKKVDPDMFKEPGIGPPPVAAWNARPRKLGGLPQVNLPVYKPHPNQEKRSREKPAIVLAFDYSGSIGPNDADRFATLARSIPQERIKLFACTFTTTYQVFDLDNPHGGGNGGTNFSAVGQFIDEHVRPELGGNYPKAVVVITDGCANWDNYRPDDKEGESVVWLLSDSTYACPVVDEFGQKEELEEFVD